MRNRSASASRRGPWGGVEGAADLQGQAAAGAFFLCQSRRGLHGGLLAAEDQLAGAVVVGDDHAAVGGSLVTGLLQGRPVQPQHRYHSRGPSGCGFLHGLAPEGHQFHGGVGVKDPGGVEGRNTRPETVRRQRRGTMPRSASSAVMPAAKATMQGWVYRV